MSVKLVQVRGREHWLVNVVRKGVGYRRRAYLDRKKYLKAEALEVEAKSKAEAEQLARGGEEAKPEKAVKVRASRKKPEPKTADGMPLFSEFAERFMRLQDPERGDYVNKESHLRLHLLPYFGEMRLDEIDYASIEDFRATLRHPIAKAKKGTQRELSYGGETVADTRKRRPKSASTRNRIVGTLRRILKEAVDRDLLDRMPKIPKERETRKEVAFLDFEEAERFLAGAGDWWFFIFVAIRTGLREGELQELRGRDVLLTGARPSIRVSRAYKLRKGEAVIGPPKSGKPRSVPLARDVAQAFRERGLASGELAFPNEHGQWRTKQEIYDAIKEIGSKTLGRHVWPHLLRHTFASHTAMRGIDLRVLQRWMGHASYTTTLRYAHLAPGAEDELIELLVPEGSRHLRVIEGEGAPEKASEQEPTKEPTPKAQNEKHRLQ